MKRKIERKFVITVSQLGENQSEKKDILGMMNPNSSYQMFSGCLNPNDQDNLDFIIGLLPFSEYAFVDARKTLLDVCLPHQESGPNKTITSTVARYLLFGRRLLGIRVCSNGTRRYGVKVSQVPFKIRDFYQKNGLGAHIDDRIPIGQFHLVFRHCKIAPIFLSEMASHPGILNEYYQYGCEIFSVFNDLAGPGGRYQKDKLCEKLKDFSESRNTSVVYYGLLKHYYHQGGAFIGQGQNLVEGFKSPTTNMLIDVDITKNSKIMYIESEDETNPISEAIYELDTKEKLAFQTEVVLYKPVRERRVTEIATQLVKDKILKVRKAKKFLKMLRNCHKCAYTLKTDCMFQCQNCFLYMCYECINSTPGVHLKSLDDYNSEGCVICTKKCDCKKCSAPTVLPAQLNDQVVDNSEKYTCDKCQILARTPLRIRLECEKCGQFLCYSCEKDNKNASLLEGFTCTSCRLRDQKKSKIVTFEKKLLNLSPIHSDEDSNRQKENHRQQSGHQGETSNRAMRDLLEGVATKGKINNASDREQKAKASVVTDRHKQPSCEDPRLAIRTNLKVRQGNKPKNRNPKASSDSVRNSRSRSRSNIRRKRSRSSSNTSSSSSSSNSSSSSSNSSSESISSSHRPKVKLNLANKYDKPKFQVQIDRNKNKQNNWRPNGGKQKKFQPNQKREKKGQNLWNSKQMSPAVSRDRPQKQPENKQTNFLFGNKYSVTEEIDY